MERSVVDNILISNVKLTAHAMDFSLSLIMCF